MKYWLCASLLVLLFTACGNQNAAAPVVEGSEESVVTVQSITVTTIRPGSCWRTSSLDNNPWPNNSCAFPSSSSYSGRYRVSHTGGVGAEMRVYYTHNNNEMQYCSLNSGQTCSVDFGGLTYFRIWPRHNPLRISTYAPGKNCAYTKNPLV